MTEARSARGDWVLVTDGGDGQARSTLATVRALGAGGYRPAVTVSSRSSLAAASRWCERRVRVPRSNEAGFADAVRAELATRPYLATFATSDAAQVALGEPVDRFGDKESLAALAAEAGIPSPPTRSFPSPAAMREAAYELDYPVVLKPPRTRYPARRVDTAARLLAEELPDDGPLMVQPFLTEPLRAVAGIVWRSEIVAAVHMSYLRTWPLECGGASAAVTVPADEELERRILPVLAGHQGLFMAQFAGPYLLDLNPRSYGSLPLAVVAGANLPVLYCDLLKGLLVLPVRARPGILYRSLEGDLRHFAKAIRSGRIGAGAALRGLRPRRGVAHGPESIRDPGPMLARVRHAMGRLRVIPARSGSGHRSDGMS